MTRPAVRLTSIGFGTTLQDRGRPGYAHLGVPRGGPADRSSAALANRLVGNAPGTTVIETLGGLAVTSTTPATLATPETGRITLSAGDRLRVGPGPGRRWTHLAVRGGFVTESVLGSMGHDLLAGLGPPRLVEGAELLIGVDPGTDLPTDFAPLRAAADEPIGLWHPSGDDLRLVADVPLGPWTVTDDVSRVGIRLRRPSPSSVIRTDGVASRVGSDGRSRPSGGLVLGAVQLTPSGEAIVMLADHPTTGGYPLIGVTDPDDLDRVAQTPVGSRIRFRRIDPTSLVPERSGSG
ncbi:MAG: allophanate hydrolase subunit 2 family protein [Actinomycetota bacterium]